MNVPDKASPSNFDITFVKHLSDVMNIAGAMIQAGEDGNVEFSPESVQNDEQREAFSLSDSDTLKVSVPSDEPANPVKGLTVPAYGSTKTYRSLIHLMNFKLGLASKRLTELNKVRSNQG